MLAFVSPIAVIIKILNFVWNMQIFPDYACRHEILNLDVYCMHSGSGSGCSWIGKLKDIEVSWTWL